MRQIGWWYDGPEEVPVDERFVDLATADDEGPIQERYAAHMLPVYVPERSAPDEALEVSFASPETLINALEGAAVYVRSKDGTESSGILRTFKPELYADGVYMVALHDVVTDDLVTATDVRNFERIEVP